MRISPRTNFVLALVLAGLGAAGPVACASRHGGPAPQSAGQPPAWDAALPTPPPPSGRAQVYVPTDTGHGPGPTSPTTNPGPSGGPLGSPGGGN